MSKEPNGDRWSRGFNKAKNSITHGPKNAINSAKQSIHEEIVPLKHDINNTVQNAKNGVNTTVDKVKNTPNNIKNRIDHAKSNINDIKNADGIKNKMKIVGGKLANKAKNSDTGKKVQQIIKSIADMVQWIAANAYPIAIISAIVLIGGNALIFIISIAQSVNPTPHYYCNTEATPSIKNTAVYKQYCMDSENFKLNNLNGHYIIQDGSGPCTDCSYNNMFMRYYTLNDVNYFDYLWGDTGMYTPEGQLVESTLLTTGGTIRRVINGGSNDTTSTTCNTSLTNGTKAFGNKHGKTITMANWGYLRDESLDIAEYEETSDYYIDNGDSEKWVFDLSLDNNAAGTTWSVFWEYTMTLESIPCITVSINGEAITGEVIKEILIHDQNESVGDAGVILYYDYTGDGSPDHAILLTGYEEDTGYWRVIDSAKGISGGFEGPMDGSGHFAIHDTELNQLLNSGDNSSGNFKLCRISYCAVSF